MRKLVKLRTVTLDASQRRLGACYDVADLRRAARQRIPRPVFDYVDEAADEEIAAAANTAAFGVHSRPESAAEWQAGE